MLYQRKDFYNTREAAVVLGVSYYSMKRYVAEELLCPTTIIERHYYYRKSEVEELQRTHFHPGDTYRQIATRFGVAINTVKKQFDRLGIKPVGYNRLHQSVVFDRDTVNDAALSLGWLENPTDES